MATVYGGGRIPIYWIVNVRESQVEVYTGPRPRGYRHRQDYRASTDDIAGEAVPLIIDGQPCGQIAVDDMLPEPPPRPQRRRRGSAR